MQRQARFPSAAQRRDGRGGPADAPRTGRGAVVAGRCAAPEVEQNQPNSVLHLAPCLHSCRIKVQGEDRSIKTGLRFTCTFSARVSEKCKIGSGAPAAASLCKTLMAKTPRPSASFRLLPPEMQDWTAKPQTTSSLVRERGLEPRNRIRPISRRYVLSP